MQPLPPNARPLVTRAAITGVNASNEGMKWYEIIPVAAVVGGVGAVTGHRDQDTELYVEAVLLDPTTNEPVARVVRKVFGNNWKMLQRKSRLRILRKQSMDWAPT